jgi:hypothetical protein
MGEIRNPSPVKLIVGFISGEQKLFQEIEPYLKRKFGEVDFRSQILPFTHTQYYNAEFGDNLLRYFISFKKLIQPQDLVQIKLFTNKIEHKFLNASRRRINIDPGYISESKLVLATTKNYSHRIYLGKGIFAEVTLYFKEHQFLPWPWTYPDYKSPEYQKIFQHIRNLYLAQKEFDGR